MWTRVRSLIATTDHTSGVLLLNRQFRRIDVRGEFDYDLGRAGQGNSLSLTGEFPAGLTTRWGAGINTTPGGGSPRYQFSYETSRASVGVRAQSTYQARSGLALSVSLTLGMSREPRSGAWSAYGHGVAGGGAASAEVFLDSNGNGVRDVGELPVQGAAMMVNNVNSAESTSADGVAFLTNVPGEQHVSLGVLPGSLEDPQWVLEDSSVQWVPRPGRTANVEFPVMVAGELSGSVFHGPESGGGALGGADLELVEVSSGIVIRRTRSDFDGFYDFTELRPGDYSVRLRPETLARWKLSAPAERQVRIAPGGCELDGLNFAVQPVGAPLPVPTEQFALESLPTPSTEPMAPITGAATQLASALTEVALCAPRVSPRPTVLSPMSPAASRAVGTTHDFLVRPPRLLRASVPVVPGWGIDSDTLLHIKPGKRPDPLAPLRVFFSKLFEWLSP